MQRASAGLSWLCLAACTAAPARQPTQAAVLRTDELPAREQALWKAWREGGSAWAALEPEVLANPSERRFWIDNLVREMVKSFSASKLSGIGESAGPFERARADLLRFPEDSRPVLVELLDVGDGIVAYLSAELLVEISQGVAPLLVPKLQSHQSETRRRALELYARLPDLGAGEAELLQRLGTLAQQDPEWIVRAQALSSLAVRGARQSAKGYVAGVLRSALADPDPAVAERAARGFGVLGEPRAIPWLIAGLRGLEQRGAPAAVKAGRTSLEALSGERRDRSLDEWEQWWEEVGSKR